MTNGTLDRLDRVLAELRVVYAAMSPDAVETLAAEILAARRIVVYGVGRTGLSLRAFAMRLMHLGLDAHAVGDMATPPVGSGDLVIASLAVGRLPTGDAILASARDAGARRLVITARPRLVAQADAVVHLPAQTMADAMTSLLPLGSPFELALTLLCDLCVVELMARLGTTNADLAARHANLL